MAKRAVELHEDRVKGMILEDQTRGRARMLNHDECPQMLHYGSGSGTTRRKVAGKASAKGARAKGMLNREGITVHATVNANGVFGPPHLLEGGASITDSMITEGAANMANGLLQVNESGVQTGETLLEFYKMTDAWLDEEQDSAYGKWTVTRPVMQYTDGHASRFADAVEKKCRETKQRQFLEPAQTSQGLQM